jgi:hypothetical protein
MESRGSQADAISQSLVQVTRERSLRETDAALNARVAAVKSFQQARFRRTYADLLASPRHGAAARFFLDELYGTRDFSQRDAQFARIVPALIRMFPADTVQTVVRLAQLHALTETLDTALGRHVDALPLLAPAYVAAWQAVGAAAQREQQITLALRVGHDLEALTRKPLLSTTLRMMRTPARAAGLAQLQQFLEGGFTTFRNMHGADEFLACIGSRERALYAALYDPMAATLTAPPPGSPLGQLPWPSGDAG